MFIIGRKRLPEPISRPLETREEMKKELQEALQSLTASNLRARMLEDDLEKVERSLREAQQETIDNLARVDQARRAYRRSLTSKQNI